MLPGRRRCCRLRRGAAARVALREIRGDGGSVDGAEDGHAGQSPGARRCCRRSATATGGAALQPAVRRCSRPRGAAAGRAGLQPAVRCCSRPCGAAAGRAGLLQDARDCCRTPRPTRQATRSRATGARPVVSTAWPAAPPLGRQPERRSGASAARPAAGKCDRLPGTRAACAGRTLPYTRTTRPSARRAARTHFLRICSRAVFPAAARAVLQPDARSVSPDARRSGTALGRSPG